MHWSRVSTIASLMIAIAAARPTLAQQADMIRGRVTAQNGASIDNARVTVTSIPNNVSKSTTSPIRTVATRSHFPPATATTGSQCPRSDLLNGASS